MSTPTRVSHATKRLLERLNREDGPFDELRARLVQSEGSLAIGAWSREEAMRARDVAARPREPFDR